MTEFSVEIFTKLSNNKLSQRIFCWEGHLRTHVCHFRQEDGGVVASSIIKKFQHVYPELTQEKEEILRALEYDRNRALAENKSFSVQL